MAFRTWKIRIQMTVKAFTQVENNFDGSQPGKDKDKDKNTKTKTITKSSPKLKTIVTARRPASVFTQYRPELVRSITIEINDGDGDGREED